jgi:hypothetical protein
VLNETVKLCGISCKLEKKGSEKIKITQNTRKGLSPEAKYNQIFVRDVHGQETKK